MLEGSSLAKRFLRFIIKAPVYPCINLIYLFSWIFPKDSNLWVFGAWFGDKYSDNSRYLYEYTLRNNKGINAIWITKNIGVYNWLTQKGYPALMSNSLKGIFTVIRAKVAVITCDKTDVHPWLLTSNHIIIELWHGVGYKKTNYDDEVFSRPLTFYGRFGKAAERILFFLFPFFKNSYRMVISTSELMTQRFSSAFRMDVKDIPITGYPRNDVLFKSDNTISLKKHLEIEPSKKLCLFVPTHRGAGRKSVIKLFFKNEFVLKSIDDRLDKSKAVLLVKLHPYHDRDIMELRGKEYKNIIFWENSNVEYDMSLMLKDADILLTDYSSVSFDYLLLNRPIIFTPFDLEEYLQIDRRFYDRYEDVTPGPKAGDWPEALRLVDEVIQNDHWKQERETVCNRFNKFRDNKNSERVFQAIWEVLA